MTQITERTVMFADLRGSTALYESLGNAEATTVVTQAVKTAAQAVAKAKGRVIKTLGDGLMAVFTHPEAALNAADDMHDALDGMVAKGKFSNAAPALRALKLQVALAKGEVVELSGDCFGDAVNVAARLLDHAGDHETLITSEVLDGLSDYEASRFRSLDRMQLRGRVESVQVHLLQRGRPGDVATQFGDTPESNEPEAIRLIWGDLNRIYVGQQMPVILGRSPQATYCIDDSRVSRSHARIDWHGGTFQVTDLSYNGTYLRFTSESEVVSLRRGTCTLHGSGTIGLGASPNDEQAPLVRFEVLRFAETTPQTPRDIDSLLPSKLTPI